MIEAQENSTCTEFIRTRALAERNEKNFSIRNELVVRLVGDTFVIVLPSDAVELREAILSELHQSALGGHLGRKKLDKLVR